jgi:hypothetical protein
MSTSLPSRPVSALSVGVGSVSQPDLAELLSRHEARQVLAARAAYSLLRITAAVPPESRFVVPAACAGQRATAWLAGSSTNPGRWTSTSVLAVELTELDVLLVDLHEQLVTVLNWVSANVGNTVGRQGMQQTIRLPRTLLAECTTLVQDLAALAPAAAA